MSDPASLERKRKWPKWLLIGSLALNLAVVGVLVGFAVRGAAPKAGGPPSMPGAISLLRAIPDSHRPEVRRAFNVQREKLRSFRMEIGDLRNQFLTVLENEPVDTEALEALLKQHSEIEVEISRNGRALLLDTIAKMDHETRQTFAENARNLQQRRGPSRDKKRYR